MPQSKGILRDTVFFCVAMTCMENCQKKNRFNGSCDQCYEGYANPFCCTCDEGFDKMLNGDCEIRKLLNTWTKIDGSNCKRENSKYACVHVCVCVCVWGGGGG